MRIRCPPILCLLPIGGRRHHPGNNSAFDNVKSLGPSAVRLLLAAVVAVLLAAALVTDVVVRRHRPPPPPSSRGEFEFGSSGGSRYAVVNGTRRPAPFAWDADPELLEHLLCTYSAHLKASRLVDNRRRRPPPFPRTSSSSSPSSDGYNVSSPADRDVSEHGQATRIAGLLGNKRNGTFLEAGAFNGEFFSNSLYLERKYGWTGILVEPIKLFFDQMLAKNRRAIMLNACVSPRPWFQYMNMTVMQSLGRRQQSMSYVHGYLGIYKPDKDKMVTVECYPLYDILDAANMTRLDALMLDVQGPEEEILRTIPWRLVDIKVILVEISQLGSFRSHRKLARRERRVRKYLAGAGYQQVDVLGRDFIFMKTPPLS